MKKGAGERTCHTKAANQRNTLLVGGLTYDTPARVRTLRKSRNLAILAIRRRLPTLNILAIMAIGHYAKAANHGRCGCAARTPGSRTREARATARGVVEGSKRGAARTSQAPTGRVTVPREKPSYIDDADFTTDHDVLSQWIMRAHWESPLLATMAESRITKGHLILEPSIGTYRRVFPDATADIMLTADHRNHPWGVTPRRSAYGTEWHYTCPVAVCGNWIEPFDDQPSEDVAWERWKKRGPPLCEREMDAIYEIKPHIDTFGRVLRQIREYDREKPRFGRARLLVLVTWDTRFDEDFRRQGVTVMHPPPRAPEKQAQRTL